MTCVIPDPEGLCALLGLQAAPVTQSKSFPDSLSGFKAPNPPSLHHSCAVNILSPNGSSAFCPKAEDPFGFCKGKNRIEAKWLFVSLFEFMSD